MEIQTQQNYHTESLQNSVLDQQISEQPSQTVSQQNKSGQNSNTKSQSSEKGAKSENSTQTDNFPAFLSLKNIKSKQEIQIESKQNQKILLNLNTNIDDLFKKISSLNQQITSNLQTNQIKQKHSWVFQKDKKELQNLHQIQIQKVKSTPLLQLKNSHSLTENKPQFDPILFRFPSFNLQQFPINMKLFQTGKSLGCGKFGEVVQCKYFYRQDRNIKTNAVYALKKIFKSVIDQYKMEDQLLTELKILRQIDHPNIVKAYEAFTDDFHIFILMEYVHGDLLLKKLKCTENQCKVIIRQVLQGLKYLHDKKITHRDIKPENIILTTDNVIKICDFGWAAQGSQPMNILCGTLDYVSPEMVREEPYTEKSDLWNLGVLTYELIFGHPPFKSGSKSRIFQRVSGLQYFFSDQIQISQQCKSFIAGFLKNENERQSIQWGLDHQFLRIQEQQSIQENEIMQQMRVLLE